MGHVEGGNSSTTELASAPSARTTDEVRRSGLRLLLPAAIGAANSAIFLFQIMIGRMENPSTYGQAIALLAVMLILEAPASTIQAAISRAVTRRRRCGEACLDLAPLCAASLVAGLIACAGLVPTAYLLKDLLHLANPPILVAFWAVPVMIGIVPKGVLAGLRDFVGVSAGLVSGSFVRLLVGTILVHGGYGISGAVGAVVAGELVSAVVLLLLARRRCTGGTPVAFAWRDAIGEGAASTGFWALAGLDLVLVQHYSPSAAAGEYGAASTLSQLVMLFPFAAAPFFFPRLVGNRLRDGSRWDLNAALVRGLLVVSLVSGLVAVVVDILGRGVLSAIFDSDYVGATAVLAPLLAAAALLGAVTILLQYLLSRRETIPASFPWVGVAILVGLTLAFHRTSREIALSLLVATICTSLSMFAVAVHGNRYALTEAPRPKLADLDADLDLTVVMPYYNPGSTLAPNLRRLLAVLDESPVDYEVIAVSDGSTDGSELTIVDFESQRLRRVALPSNQGKGAALKAGLEEGRGRYLGFIDADGDLDPVLLQAFMALVDLYQPDVVIGSKRHPLSEVQYPPLRWLYSVGFQYLVKCMFQLNVRDTQTGIKILRRDVLAASLPRMVEKRFAFDLELLVVARRLGFRRVLEAPVVLKHQFTSTVSIRSVFHTFLDAVAILYRLRLLRTYDQTPTTDRDVDGVSFSAPFLRSSIK